MNVLIVNQAFTIAPDGNLYSEDVLQQKNMYIPTHNEMNFHNVIQYAIQKQCGSIFYTKDTLVWGFCECNTCVEYVRKMKTINAIFQCLEATETHLRCMSCLSIEQTSVLIDREIRKHFLLDHKVQDDFLCSMLNVLQLQSQKQTKKWKLMGKNIKWLTKKIF